MAKKKNGKVIEEKVVDKNKVSRDSPDEEPLAPLVGEEPVIDPAIIEDTFTEEFSEYNDVDNL